MTGQADLFKRAGIELVTSHNLSWMDQALQVIAGLRAGALMTGEDIRHAVEETVGPPGHHNAYGALVSHAVRRKLLYKTPIYRKMRDPKSHARQTPVYTIPGPQ